MSAVDEKISPPLINPKIHMGNVTVDISRPTERKPSKLWLAMLALSG